MPRACALTALLWLAGCPGPIEQTCNRLTVDSTGATQAAGGFGGAGGSGALPPSPVGVVGEPVTLTTFASLTACVSDPLRVRAEIVGPDNLPVETDVTLTTPRLTGAGPVTSDLSFTPKKPGLYIIRIAYEPSLGVRSIELQVAESRLGAPTVTVPVPNLSGCLNNVWPLTEDTVVCERASRIEVLSSDGGLTSFSGEQLVVVDDVLWSVERASSTLERRVFADGGLSVTNTFTNVDTRPVPAMHDVDFAIRARLNGSVALFRVGTSPRDLSVFASSTDGTILWLDGETLFNGGTCFSADCVSDLRGLEPNAVWSGDPLNFGLIAGRIRPIVSLEARAQHGLRMTTESLEVPQRGFERVPLWLPQSNSDRSLLVSADGSTLGFTAWKRADVLRVGRRFVVLKDSGPSVRVAGR